MTTLNSVRLIGRVYEDPIEKYYSNGVNFCILKVVVNDFRFNEETKITNRFNVFIPVICRKFVCDSAMKCAKKGALVFIDGSVMTGYSRKPVKGSMVVKSRYYCTIQCEHLRVLSRAKNMVLGLDLDSVKEYTHKSLPWEEDNFDGKQ